MSDLKMKNTPSEIWLIVGNGHDLTDAGFDFNAIYAETVCWCSDPQGEYDVRYVRADIHESQLAELRDEIARLKAEREWLPIETAPKDGTLVLGYFPGACVLKVYCKSSGIWHQWHEDYEVSVYPPPTHWQPLPPPPTEEKQ